ncbi:hypothetical protein R3P38DRAFT_178243 [Favolaschia claudopus]|uniref:Secreted protein n=1 Tax=Favolaschia claudopus TaxID=2862362 RepID=A0AAW0D1Y6_9AGAR
MPPGGFIVMMAGLLGMERTAAVTLAFECVCLRMSDLVPLVICRGNAEACCGLLPRPFQAMKASKACRKIRRAGAPIRAAFT